MGSSVGGCFYGFDDWFMDHIRFGVIALIGVIILIDFLPPD
jgi:hypothetical protein